MESSLDHPVLDNNRLVVVSETRGDFDLAMQLAFRQHLYGGCVGWSIYNPRPRPEWDRDRPEELLGVHAKEFLVLHSYVGESDRHITRLPVKLDWMLAANFSWAWLEQQEYGEEPHDGSNGFILFNEPWGHVGADHSAIIAVGPAWAIKGK